MTRKTREPRRREVAPDERPAAPALASRRSDWPWAVALVLLTLVTFGYLVTCEFLSWDDYGTVARNPVFNPPGAEAFTRYWRQPHMDLYVPLTYTAWALLAGVSWLAGPAGGGPSQSVLNPAVFHAANLALHAAAAVVVFRLIRRLRVEPLPAFLGAALFAVHPVQVEPVGWVSGLKDVLCGLLVLVSVWQYLEFADETGPPRRRRLHYAAATVAFVLALLAKPTAVVAPAVAFVLDTLALNRPARRSALALAPWLVPAAACFLWTKAVQPAHHAAAAGVAAYFRPLVAADALAFYLYKLAWPAALTVDYGRTPQLVVSQGWAYVTWLAPAVVVAVLVWQRRRVPLALAGAVVFALGVAPVLGLVRFDFQVYSTVADHYLYPSMAGAAIVAAALLARWRRSRGAYAAAGVLLAALAVRSALQTRYWADTFTAFRHALAVNPDSWAAHNTLAAAYTEAGQPAPALEHARRAAALRPDRADVAGSLGAALAMNGRFPEAIESYRHALQIDPDRADAHAALAGLYAQTNQTAAALEHGGRAVELAPDDAQAQMNYGTVLAQAGRLDEGIAHLEAATRLAPRALPQAHANLGFLLLARGRPGEAAARFRAALAINPSFVPAQRGLQQAVQQAQRVNVGG